MGRSRAFSRRVSVAGAGVVLGLCHCGSNASPEAHGADGGRRDATTDVGRSDAPGDVSRADVRADAEKDGPRDHATVKDAPLDVCKAVAPTDAAPVPCGSRSGMRGLTHRSIAVGCVTRTYEVYLPATFDPTKPMPFVFVFHGYQMSGDEMRLITDYTAIADAEGVAIAFPDGEGGPHTLVAPWNIANPGQVVCGSGDYVMAHGDDMGFIDAMKADVSEDQCLDKEHLFSTGFSMGGYLTHHIACYRKDMRAAAPHSGGTMPSLADCTTGHVPILMFHGKADPVIDDACDDPSVPHDVGFPASANLWAAKNGCQMTYTTVPNEGDAGGSDAGSAGQCFLYDGCPADGQVEVCTFDGMGHCWAGGHGDTDPSACPTYASATQLQWAFFKKYAW